MQDKTTFTATEARQNFFDLLRLVDAGKEPVIRKEDSNKQYKVIGIKKERSVNKMKALKELARVNFHVGSWEKAKKIISTMHNVEI